MAERISSSTAALRRGGFPVRVAPEVAAAVSAGKPVLAFESTIITHGMPYPDNVASALALEQIARAQGVVPATVAVVAGEACVGLDARQLEQLGNDRAVVKAASRDIALVMAAGGSAGTTVSATMVLAEAAGVAVFATGGIGGVHRGAELTFDVSADLVELGRTPTAVVCAGCKSILDIPKTLEVLETYRVPVLGYRTKAFPAFYTRDSGLPLDHGFADIATLARAVALHRAGPFGSGLLIANPIPEADALDPAYVEQVVAASLAEAAQQGISGKAVTPFLLTRLLALTGGRSLAANLALVRHNALVGAQLAKALSALR
jgi:pseudouridylate synthase